MATSDLQTIAKPKATTTITTTSGGGKANESWFFRALDLPRLVARMEQYRAETKQKGGKGRQYPTQGCKGSTQKCSSPQKADYKADADKAPANKRRKVAAVPKDDEKKTNDACNTEAETHSADKAKQLSTNVAKQPLANVAKEPLANAATNIGAIKDWQMGVF